MIEGAEEVARLSDSVTEKRKAEREEDTNRPLGFP